jgi:3-(3-hydroxy-phenyl)propionate hydroxylase
MSNPTQSHYPVIIVGGGPAGLLLGNLLGTFGVHALLIEKNPATVHEPRAVSIDDESLRTMQAIGLVDEVRAQIVAGYGSHYHPSPTGACFMRVEPTGEPYGYPRRNAFRQPNLEVTLKQGLGRFPHIEACYGVTLRDFSQTADAVTAEIETETGPQTLTADYLVGCDGSWSTVRQKLGIILEGTTFDERWLIVDVKNNVNQAKHTKVYCNPERSGLTLPGPDNTRRWEFKLHPGEKDEDLLKPEVVHDLIMTHDADPNAELVRKTVYRFHARVAKKWDEGRVFMAGDAVHLTPPFAGQGMNSGVRDVHNLSWKLAAVLAKTTGPGLLASYRQERYDHVWDMIRLALMMGRVFSPRDKFDALRTRTFFRSLRLIPPLHDYVAQMKYKPKPRFREGFLVPDGRSKRRTLVGRLLPQPRVRLADGREVLLDEAVGNRFALLARTATPAATFARLNQPIWDKLGAVRVALLPPGTPNQPSNSIISVTETNNALDNLGDNAILLRPDHYVAAAIPLATADIGAAQVATLLQQTWDTQPNA